MISVRTGIRAEEVKLQGQHVLFVEGKDRNAVDPKVLDELFEQSIRIEPLGPSFSVRSVAEALFSYHPTYYFLIDRDHHDNDFVERCWENFPDPNTHNLLVWRRREIENYFLEPAYLFQSKYCQVSQDEVERKVLECANQRLFLDVANHVVTSIREELKRNWIRIFSNPDDFPTKETALQKLRTANEFDEHRANVHRKVSEEEVERRFHEILEKMTGGLDQLTFGTGEWLSLIQGKKVLAQVINSGCFQVNTADGTPVNGREKINVVVKDLLQKDSSVQPADFTTLKQLIDTRINGTN
ncbi:MAG: hypothetical protein Kow0029_21610 [Candidatus Rifleibacteriota bacterium]